MLGSMGASRRFLRFVAEFEIEVFDPVQAAAFAHAWGYSADDAVEPDPDPEPTERQVWYAVEQAMFLRLDDAGIRAGFAVLGGSVTARQLDATGRTFVEMTVPPVPARQVGDEDLDA